jgi:hypothetical protein
MVAIGRVEGVSVPERTMVEPHRSRRVESAVVTPVDDADMRASIEQMFYYRNPTGMALRGGRTGR